MNPGFIQPATLVILALAGSFFAAAAILAVVAFIQIATSGGRVSGTGRAVGALVLSVFGPGFALPFVLLVGSPESDVTRRVSLGPFQFPGRARSSEIPPPSPLRIGAREAVPFEVLAKCSLVDVARTDALRDVAHRLKARGLPILPDSFHPTTDGFEVSPDPERAYDLSHGELISAARATVSAMETEGAIPKGSIQIKGIRQNLR